MNITTKIGAVALTAALAIGGTTAAFAGGDSGSGSGSTTASTTVTTTAGTPGTSSTAKEARIAKICANKDEIVSKLTSRQTNLTARLAKLQAAEKTATDGGHPKVADKIEVRISKVQGRLDKVSTRLAKAPEFIAQHCS